MKNFGVSDFILGNASYFQTGGEIYSAESMLPEEAIAAVNEQKCVTDGGRIFGKRSTVESNGRLTDYLENYTTKVDPNLDYESKQTSVDELNGFRNMFLLMGCVLSFIVGTIGILNFLDNVK